MYLEITPEPFVVYRSIGPQKGERYGIGFVSKNTCCNFSNRARSTYVLALVVRGRGSYCDRFGNEYPLEPGSVFQRFLNQPASVSIVPGSNWLECFLELGRNMVTTLENHGCLNRETSVLRTSPNGLLAEKFHSLRNRFLEESELNLMALLPEIMSLVQECFSGSFISERVSERRHLVEEACIHLGGNFTKPDRLDEFCRHHCVGYENFRKIFKQLTGMSPHHYRIRRRLDKACALLMCPELSITEIARQLGYSSPYEFSAQFRRLIGVPPSSYRLKNAPQSK